MKIIVIIILVAVSVVLFGNGNMLDFDLTKFDTIQNNYQPAYMKVQLLDNYFINQPIKETIKWSSIGLIGGLIDYYYFPNHRSNQAKTEVAIGLGGGILCGTYGIFKGIYQGLKFNKASKKNVTPDFKQEVFTHEMKFINSFQGRYYRYGSSYAINVNINNQFIDKFSLVTSNVTISKQIPYNSNFNQPFTVHYNTYALGIEKQFIDKIITPLAGVELGCLSGNFKHKDNIIYQKKDLYCNFSGGLMINIVDLFSIKYKLIYEYSGFFNTIDNDKFIFRKDNFSQNYSIEINIF